MSRRAFGSLMVLVVMGAACGDDDVKLIIQHFPDNRVEIQVNQVYNKIIKLSRKVNEKTYVDIDNAEHTPFIDLPEFAVFKPGENTHTLALRGVAATGGDRTVVFTIRDTSSTRNWIYRIGDGGATNNTNTKNNTNNTNNTNNKNNTNNTKPDAGPDAVADSAPDVDPTDSVVPDSTDAQSDTD